VHQARRQAAPDIRKSSFFRVSYFLMFEFGGLNGAL
jgi:hypothetical protein